MVIKVASITISQVAFTMVGGGMVACTEMAFLETAVETYVKGDPRMISNMELGPCVLRMDANFKAVMFLESCARAQ